MRILKVEGEPGFAEHVMLALIDVGIVVDITREGLDGKRMALAGSFDFTLLEAMPPGIEDFGVLLALHERRDLPMVLLTASDAAADWIVGLRMGADDYLVKPLTLPALLARVQTLLRASHPQNLAVLQIGDLQLDLVKHRATRSGTRLNLSAQDFKLLALLLRRQGQVQSRTILAEQVWNINFDCDTNVVDVAVRRLRKKMDDPFSVKLLHTVRGVGYVLETRA